MGKAGSMSFHHVRALHGSAMNTSNRPRNLLLNEVAASDAWPLMGVKDFDEFNSRLISGDPVIAPRMTNVPVRLPLPPAKRQGSIYETQSAAGKSWISPVRQATAPPSGRQRRCGRQARGAATAHPAVALGDGATAAL